MALPQLLIYRDYSLKLFHLLSTSYLTKGEVAEVVPTAFSVRLEH